MLSIPIVVTAALLGSAVQTQVLPLPAPEVSSCTAETERSHRVAFNLATDPNYAAYRLQAGLPQMAATAVRVLSDPADAPLCERMLQYASNVAASRGGSLAGETIVYYQAGSSYIAVMWTEPVQRTPRPGYARIVTGWVQVYVFDSSLSNAKPLLM